MAALVFGASIKPSSRAAEYFAAPSASVETKLLAGGPADSVQTAVLVAVASDDGTSAPPTIGRFGSGDESAAESDGVRREYLEDAVEYVVERPVPGYGFRWIESAHNLYHQLRLSGGILALAGFMIFVFGYLRAGLRSWGTAPESMGDTARAATISVALMLITGMVGNGMVDRYLYLPFALVFAMQLITTRPQKTSRPSDPEQAVSGSEQGAVKPADG
jgi:hypothetical protein